jgi:exodeoxyribonuclease VII large subunit
MPDDIPSLADLRRARSSRAPRRAAASATPSLFDNPPQAAPKAPSAPHDVTSADVLAEQARALQTPSTPSVPAARQASTQRSASDRASDAQVYTVGELVRRIRAIVERSYGHVTVEGEISNWRPASSGHCYFTLKDGEAQLSIVLFRRQAALLRFRPKDGDAVRISGSLSVYDSRGQLQLIAETMQQTGLGALLAATQALKERLRREGLFANARPLPPFPRCIGIVTSVQGAALRDIVKVCRRRHSAVNLLIYPAAVQGPNCPAEIAAGVRWFSEHAEHADVVLVARGGGSWEDLHGFDHEIVARAIAACSIPVITGIGHAPDSTIADAAADICAPTPSAAAELLTAAQHNIAAHVADLETRLLRATRYELLRTRQRLSHLSADAVLGRVRNSLERRAQRLDDLSLRAESTVSRALRSRAMRLDQLEARLRRQHVTLRLAKDAHRLSSLDQRLQAARTAPLVRAQTRVARATTQLEALSPIRVLDRGYALVYIGEGTGAKLLRNAADAPAGTSITAHLAAGRLRAKVTEAS